MSRRLLLPPDDLAALHLQLALWPGFECADWPRRSRVVLACCHLDHDPTHNAARNLAALCQPCHLEHDRADNLARRRRNARRRIAGAAGVLPNL